MAQQKQGPNQQPQRPIGGDGVEDRIRDIFRSQFRQLAALFPSDGEIMANRACAMAIQASRKCRDKAGNSTASPESIAETAMACLSLGLEFGDQAYCVPYKGQASLIVGPRGLIALAYRSGFVKSIEARSVFEGDIFEYEFGTSPKIRHVKATNGRRPEKVIDTWKCVTHAYCIIDTTTGGRIVEVLTGEDLDFYRGFSKAESGPWFDNYEGMVRKTVEKRALEFVPRSPLLAAALRSDDHDRYQIPEEIWATIRAKEEAGGGRTNGAQPAQPEQVKLAANGGTAAREPGEDG